MTNLAKTLPCQPFQAAFTSHGVLQRRGPTKCQSVAPTSRQDEGNEVGKTNSLHTLRRDILIATMTSTAALCSLQTSPALAVQGSTAGRIPGLSKEKDEEGFHTYRRPEGKSGGHGVGWSEIPVYSFKVPDGWKEVPVSIADLGGTEIDLRFGNEQEGSMAIVVAPVLRFADVGFNADVRLEELGSPAKMIGGFGPELFGSPLQDGDVTNTEVTKNSGLTFYYWDLKPHRLVSATAYKNRVFLMAIQANGRQWRKSGPTLKKIQQSFGLSGVTV